ncbi:MAG TPA: hypothetical protein VE869_06115 [Gemmatimonas sp.]|nr:hypothetical protein [Gemmatimonas sp.]
MPLQSFSARHIVPDGRAALAFTCVMPADWVEVPLPPDSTDFGNPAAFAALFICTAPYGAVLFTVAARPAFDDGTVEDWARYLSDENRLRVEKMQEARIGRCPCVLSNATMETDAGVMRSRSVFLEDGGRLFNIGTLAPEAIWPAVEDVLQGLIGSFVPDEIHGITVAPMRLMTADGTVDLTFDASKFHAAHESSSESTGESTSQSTGESISESSSESSSQSTTETTDDAERASEPIEPADDASSLDPEHEMNVRLRDAGMGLVPRVLAIDAEARTATIGAGAIEGIVRVPFGWHVLDDGRRTLVFDRAGAMQINLDLRYASVEEHGNLLQGIGDELAAANPSAEFQKLMMGDCPCLAVRNLPVDGALLQQAYLVQASHRPEMALLCRVTADDDHMTHAFGHRRAAAGVVRNAVERLRGERTDARRCAIERPALARSGRAGVRRSAHVVARCGAARAAGPHRRGRSDHPCCSRSSRRLCVAGQPA